LPHLARIEGRSADVFWLQLRSGSRALPNVLFKNAFDVLHEVREWQAVQHGPRRILLRLEPLPGRVLDPVRVRQTRDGVLEAAGLGGDLDFAWEATPRPDPDPATGKFRRFIGMARAGQPPVQVAQPA
jgi:hypothetical protein